MSSPHKESYRHSLSVSGLSSAQSIPSPGMRNSIDLVSQTNHISLLQQRVSELEAKLKIEERRAALYEQEIEEIKLIEHTSKKEVADGPPKSLMKRSTSVLHLAASQSSSVQDESLVTISRKEYELLLLKDKAMGVLQEGISIADCSRADNPLIYVNAGFTRITGYSAAETVGKNCRFLQGEGTVPGSVETLRSAIKSGRSCVVNLINYRKNGDPFVNYLSVTPIHDAQGRLTHYVGVQSDITELVNHRQAELAAKHAAVQAAAATEAKSEFLARMSHEIRTPLNGIISVGQLLAETRLTPGQWDLVNTIRCSGETLLTLITDILDFSRIEANKLVLVKSVFKIEAVMEAALEIAGLRAAQKKIQVAYHISKSVPSVLLGDAQRLQQILLNILNNAVKFTEEGCVLLEVWVDGDGSLGSTVSDIEIKEGQESSSASGGIGVSSTADGEFLGGPKVVLRFSVRDTGIGISPADITRLFNSFTQVDPSPTRRYGGSGLGLVICKRLCEAMGGGMWCESEGQGQGSSFYWTVEMRAPRLVINQNQRRRSVLMPLGDEGKIAAQPQAHWQKIAEKVGAAFMSSTGDVAVAGLPQHERMSIIGFSSGGKNSFAFAANASVRSAASYGDEHADKGQGQGQGQGQGSKRNDSPAAAPLIQDKINPLLVGKRVLLLEPTRIIRHVLMLALNSWGCLVYAVSDEDEAIKQLVASRDRSKGISQAKSMPQSDVLSSGEVEGFDSGPVSGCTLKTKELMLRSAELINESRYQSPGPYDIILMDMNCTGLLKAITECESEAQRIIFFGWPGQSEFEKDDTFPMLCSVGSINAQEKGLGSVRRCSSGGDLRNLVAMGAADLKSLGALQPAERRHLGYVVVSRPVRQGRLMLAMEEVLGMDLENSPLSCPSSFEEPYYTPLIGSLQEASNSLAEDMNLLPRQALMHLAQGQGSGGSDKCENPTASESNLARDLIGDDDNSSQLLTTLLIASASASNDKPPSKLAHSSSSNVASSTDRRINTSSPLTRVNGSSSSLQLQLTTNCTLRQAPSRCIVSQEIASDSSTPTVPLHTLRSIKVLIAEDNMINMKVACSILKRVGGTVVVQSFNGLEALQAVEVAGGLGSFDLILMDLHMPMMGGIECVKELRRRWPEEETMIVAVTADAFDLTKGDCDSAGFNGFLPKPFRVEEMANVVSDCQRSSRRA